MVSMIVVVLFAKFGLCGFGAIGYIGVTLTIMLVLQFVLNMIYGGCPMTILENNLRRRADPKYVPMRSFVSDQCARRFGWDIPPEMVRLAIIVLLALSVIAIPMTIGVSSL